MNGPRNERFQYEMKNKSLLRDAYMPDRLLPPSPPNDAYRSTEVSESQSSNREELQSFYMTIDSDCLDQPYRTSPVHYQNAHNQRVKKRKWPVCCQKTCLCLILLFIALLSSCTASTGVLLAFFPSEIYNAWLKTVSSPLQNILSESYNQNKLLLSNMEEQLDYIIATNEATQELLITSLNDSQYGFPSCSFVKRVSAKSPSGYYWVRGQSNHSALVYCEMSQSCGSMTGGWTRLASFNFKDCSIACPSGLKKKRLRNSTFCTCGIKQFPPGCSSVMISLPTSVEYTSICGRVAAYARGNLRAFKERNGSKGLEEVYVDGISLTRILPKLRVHIWTFAIAQNSSQCPNNESETPSFVGNNYFCAATDSSQDNNGYFGPLWSNPSECSNCQELFHKKLSGSTSDHLELRLCSDENRSSEDITIEALELYVQ